ncbi:MAG: hypothetical protein FD180_5091 [Planctomycetota bacterium]|nr:MAG: hypothetical protein FD180_5091 [Planctomycetota bacterium]
MKQAGKRAKNERLSWRLQFCLPARPPARPPARDLFSVEPT